MRIAKYIAIIFIPLLFTHACGDFDDFASEDSLDTWQSFNKNSGLKGNETWCVFSDSKGNIWVGLNDYGIMKYDGENWTNYSTSHGLIDNCVLSIAEDVNGDLWIGTFSGFSVFDGNTFTNYLGTDGNVWTVTAVYSAFNGDIWMGTMSHGLFQVTSNGIYSIYAESDLDRNYINSITQDNTGTIWAGTNSGVYEISGQNYKVLTEANGLESSIVKAICCDSWGDVWLGTWESEYISRYEDGNFKQISLFNGSVYAFTNAIAEDLNGNIWIGLINDGVAKYDGASMHTYHTDDGLAGKTVVDITVDNNGNIWFATLSDGVSVYTPKID